MTQYLSAQPPAAGAERGPRHRRRDVHRNEVTDIIPFNEFGNLDDLDCSHSSAFGAEALVLRAPELDDLHETDNLSPRRLIAPGDFETERLPAYRPPDPLRTAEPWRGGQHRKQMTGVVKGRVLFTAMAAGAAAAAAQLATHPAHKSDAGTVLAAEASALDGGAVVTSPRGMQMVTVKPAANDAMHNEELARGVAFAQERAQREARLQQPLYVMPTKGIFTSNFGYRWGVLHAGIDLANAIGTPILAVSDGVVIAAGPTAGYGMWVKVRHSDGTVTLYGHVNTTTVSVGQRVMAGDQIATMGNRGDSTGPHLHFEVLLGGSNRVDPLPWLAKRGLSVGNFVG